MTFIRVGILRAAGLAAAMAVGFSTGSAYAGPVYSFTVLAQTSNSNDQLANATLNDSSQAVWYDLNFNGSRQGSIVSSASGVVVSGSGNGNSSGAAGNADPTNFSSHYVQAFINASGDIAFESPASPSLGNVVWDGNGNVLMTSAPGGIPSDIGNLIGFTDSGTPIAASKWNGNNDGAIFSPSAVLWQTSNNVGGLAAMVQVGGPTAANSSGGFAFIGSQAGIGSGQYYALVPPNVVGGLGLTPAPFVGQFAGNYIAIADNGGYAYEAIQPSGSGVEIVTGSGIIPLVTTGFSTLAVDINNQGEVAYSGFTYGYGVGPYMGGWGLFTQYGPVILSGDTIAGKTVQTISADGAARFLNNNGDIVTEVTFTDGTEAIVLATDTSAPEPATWLLLGTGCVTLLACGKIGAFDRATMTSAWAKTMRSETFRRAPRISSFTGIVSG